MPTDEPLITALIDQIHKVHPLVTKSVAARLKDLLNGKLSDGPLTDVELRRVAKALIEDMATAFPKGKAK